MEVPSRLASFLVSEDELPPEFLQVIKILWGSTAVSGSLQRVPMNAAIPSRQPPTFPPHSGTHYVDQVGLKLGDLSVSVGVKYMGHQTQGPQFCSSSPIFKVTKLSFREDVSRFNSIFQEKQSCFLLKLFNF